jgi:DNA repair protein RecO (recombination protein O)
MLTNDFAICIRAVDYSETSQIVTFFARNSGKVAVIAKGAKRQCSPFGGTIEMFSCGNIAFSDSAREKLATLIEFEPLSGIADSSVLSKDFFILNCCTFAGELINIFTKDYDPHPGLFDSFVKLLQDMTNQNSRALPKGNILARLISFQVNLLKEIGLCPAFENCVNCNTPFNDHWLEIYFSNNAKGLICRDCQGAFPDKIRIEKQAAKGLADAKSLISAEDKIVRQVEEFWIRYITDILGRAPRMAKYILNW